MINIPQNVYFGLASKHRTIDRLPVATIIPDGKSSYERTRIKKFIKENEHVYQEENIPLPGFMIMEFNSGLTKYPVADPRGLVVMLPRENVSRLISEATITKGIIQEECVWAREDSTLNMTLILAGSDAHQLAIKNTQILDNKISKRDVNIGDTVALQNGLQGRYMGTMTLYGNEYNDIFRKFYIPKGSLRRGVIEVEPKKYLYLSDPKILNVVKRSPIEYTLDDSISEINENINAEVAEFTSYAANGVARFYSFPSIKLASRSTISKPTIRLEKIDLTEAIELLNWSKRHDYDDVLVLRNVSGNMFIVTAILSQNIARGFDELGIPVTAYPIENEIEDPRRLRILSRKAAILDLCSMDEHYKIVKVLENETYI